MTATTISTETVPQAPAPGTKTNGTFCKYNPRNYLSDRAKVTEIDGSECDKPEPTQWRWVELMFFLVRGLMACEGPGIVSFVSQFLIF